MDPSRNDFNGSGLPPHRRQSQDQGQPQQLSGFPFQVRYLPFDHIAIYVCDFDMNAPIIGMAGREFLDFA
jgi:hypothetical protein